MSLRLAVVTSHPVQYQVPWFRGLARWPGIDLVVLYALIPDAEQQGIGFGIDFQWDVPLLQGYGHETLDNVSRKPSLGTFWGCDTPHIQRTIRARRFDAVILTGWQTKSSLQALWACLRAAVPVIVRGESNNLKPRPLTVRVAHRLLLRAYKAFLVIGSANRAFYVANGISADRLFETPYCVDNARFGGQADLLRPDRRALRAAWGIPDESFVFLFCGKLIEKKQPLVLLEALHRVSKHWPEMSDQVHLLVTGEGPLRAECEARARRMALPVSFSGFLNQSAMPKAYAAADCLVLPSDYGETWGLVVNEAMASGIPAIVSDRVGCHPDLVVEGRTGHTFPFGDVQSLADALVRVSREPHAARAMGRAARALVDRYDYQHVTQGTIAALQHVVSNRIPLHP